MTAGEISSEGTVRRALVAGAVVLGVLIAAVGARICLEFGLAWRCPLLTWAGVPCPSCGSTRAFAALAGMDLAGALRFNPLMVLGVLGLPIFIWVKQWPEWLQRSGWAIFGTLVGLNWAYLIVFLPR